MSRFIASISVVAIAATVLVACASVTPSAQFGVATQVTDEPPCVVFRQPVAVGTPITLEVVAPHRTIRAQILQATTECAGNETVEGLAYFVKVRRGVGDLGIVTATAGVHPHNLLFHNCASNEGVHLTVWQHGRRIWHEYYYVPYATEPTCTDEESRTDG